MVKLAIITLAILALAITTNNYNKIQLTNLIKGQLRSNMVKALF